MSTTRGSIHVLHVDDEPDFADMVADFLETRDGPIHVRTETDPGSALALLNESKFDCIVSDYDMPEYNGLEFLEKVREERPDMPFILYTGKGSEVIASKAITAGVTDYLQKGGGTEQYTILANRIVNATDRSRSDREVERTREYFRTILDQASDYVMIVGEDGTVEYISPSVKRVLGFSPEELMKSDSYEYVHPDDQSKAAAAFIELFENPAEENTVEFRARHADGSWRWVEVRGRNLLEDPVIEGVMVNVRDITKRKERGKKLQRYEYAFESSLSGIAIASSEGKVIDVNPAAVDMWGYDDKEAVIGRSVAEVWKDPEKAATGLETIIEKGESWEGELEAVRADGSCFYARGMVGLLTDGEGEPLGTVAAFMDITERKEYEQQLEEQRNNFGVLNEVLRHDIRNYLQLVNAYADLLADTVADENQGYVETIRENAKHAIEFTTTARDMSDVWMSDTDGQIQISLQSPLENELDETRSVYTDSIVTVDGTIPDVTVLANDMLNSVFHNVLQNAIRHNDKDIPKVEVSVEEREETVEVRVADNGPGVPDGQKETIFGEGEKGLNTSGTGLGLYLVKTLMESYDGPVWVEDNEPEGTVFVVELQKAASE